MERLADKEKEMRVFEKCPVCGGELMEKEVEKLLKGGVHTAVVRVHADVCLQCGERLYAVETIKLFEQIRQKLERQEVAEFQPLGQTFQVV
jgi:YgiT-type zinc finger domain-containing protein